MLNASSGHDWGSRCRRLSRQVLTSSRTNSRYRRPADWQSSHHFPKHHRSTRMVRLADLPDWERQHMLSKVKDCAGFDTQPWIKPPALDKCRVAIISTAGLHARGDRPFGPSANATDYRIIPGD